MFAQLDDLFEDGHRVSRKRVVRLMREIRLRARVANDSN
jgi:hypothetical protein